MAFYFVSRKTLDNSEFLMRFFAPLLILLALHSNAWAADKDGRFAVRNAGMVSCEMFVAEKKQDSTKFGLYMGWIDGYLSAANQFTPETFDLVPWGNTVFLAALLENHCTKNPEQKFYVAVNKLASAMMSQRLVAHSKMVKVSYKNNKTYIYQTILMDVQKHLKNIGLYTGNVQGEFNADTRSALEQFQKNNNLAVTGLPDQLTLYKLFRAMSSKKKVE